MDKKVSIGQIVEVTITGIQPYGAFAKLPDGSDGLIHISEISSRFVRNVENFVHVQDVVDVKVLDIDPTTGQAKLSLKAIDASLKRREKRATYHHPRRSIHETPKGFQPLADMLPVWIETSKAKY